MRTVVFVLMMSLTSTALAQTAVRKRHDTPSEKYDIAMHNPQICDDETDAAAISWRQAGTAFQPSFNGFKSGYVAKNVDEPFFQVSFEGAGSLTNINYTAQVFETWTNRYFAYNGASYWISSDADVIVNFDHYQAGLDGIGYFGCGDAPTGSQQHDFHTIMAHEFGHVGGVGHDASVGVCANSEPTNTGPYKGLCPDAVTKMRDIYNVTQVYTQ